MYQLSHDDLFRLLMLAYDEGNHGFMDLAENVVEKIIIDEAEKFKQLFTTLPCANTSIVTVSEYPYYWENIH